MATLVQADWLFLLTDVDYVYTANPNIDPTATPIYEVHDLTKLQVGWRHLGATPSIGRSSHRAELRGARGFQHAQRAL